MTQPVTFVGMDIGGTNVKLLAFGADGGIIAEAGAPTGDDGSTSWRDRARETLHSFLGRCPGPVGVGIATPGLPAHDGRAIASMPGRLAGLEGLDWQEWLALDRPVPVLNDARAALMGELWLGAAQECQNVVLLTLGTGVGGAAMVDGRVLHGHLGRAGHLGHVSLNPTGPPDIANTPGSLEDAIGEHTVRQRTGGLFDSTRDLVEAYRRGSSEAAEVWLASVRALAAAIASFVNVLDPEIILVGGGIADANEALFGPLQTALDLFEWRPGGAKVRLVKAALGGKAGATGAAYGAKLLATK